MFQDYLGIDSIDFIVEHLSCSSNELREAIFRILRITGARGIAADIDG